MEWLEHVLHRWTSYVIVPVFALANAGIVISIDGLHDAAGSSVAWGIFVGLVVGKPVGVTVARRIAVRSGLAHDGGGATTGSNVGIAAAAGVGFTVALFIADLAFTDDGRRQEAKLAILVASIVAAAASLVVFRISARRMPPVHTADAELSSA